MVSLSFFITLLFMSSSLHFSFQNYIYEPKQSRNGTFNITHVSEIKKIETLVKSNVILNGNGSSIFSENKSFKLGLFNTNDETKWYLGIWYVPIPTPTYVWVANREKPIKNPSLASVEIDENGKLVVKEDGQSIVWLTNNEQIGTDVKLLDEGNLVLVDKDGGVVWKSFDYPTDTWLPGMNLTDQQTLTSWKSSNDPAPGKFSLRLSPHDYGEIELVYNGSYSYWTTGNWTGSAFSGVPEMTIPYIYKFYFVNPFTKMAEFGYSEVSLEKGAPPPITRFLVDVTGQLKQFTWSPQTENWNMFWSQPENLCRVYGLCGNMGLCSSSRMFNPCRCLVGFNPVDDVSWDARDFSGGCRRGNDDGCRRNDGFNEAGVVNYDGASVVSFSGTRSECDKTCLSNCSCIGLHYNVKKSLCNNLYGSLLNLRNATSDSIIQDMLYVRVQSSSVSRSSNSTRLVLIVIICGLVLLFMIATVLLLIMKRTRNRRKEDEEESVFPVTNLKVFSYKELHSATKGFSEKLGHGGFGAVFSGVLSDSTLVAVKRLERPGGGEKEFRAEVCTIGNIQHVNLVRLRGFCSEDSHRLLVYDYMPNGPLSSYLKRDGKNLSWDIRFRVAVATARGIAYLHEECENCIIHCDIKPENILLDEDFSAKVSDFGLAKLIGRDFSRVLATMRGTWGYVAPEWISGVAITSKADVYSYGMTLLELIGGRRNVEGPPSESRHGDSKTEDKWFFPPWAARQIIEGNVSVVIDERLGGTYDVAEAQRVGLIAVWCIQDDESMRPTMGLVVRMLEGVVEVTVPPPPKLLQALVSGESFHGVGVESSNRLSRDSASSSDSNIELSVNSKYSHTSA
ncbi:hypothetical protein LIER_38174 [Lithospermum erythrorhizon]|uniref:Receptor-like serine/threonine-protein kinase n=1 Tax=Lithospermum erythrorhizon TaxID=34254 RepID=A0AAV3PXA1_LITER